jgi:molybdopterin synthase catalytic subunit
MQVTVKFFAIFREMLGIRNEKKEIADNTTVEQLWKEYSARNPRTANLRAAYAVNQKIVAADYVLRDGDEVGFLPPVSGGAPRVKSKANNVKRNPPHTTRKPRNARLRNNAFITRKPIDLNALYQHVSFSGAGAILLFSGIVRDNAQGKSVDHLEYEAYPAMAEQSMRQIIDEIHARWADVRVAMSHRIGKLKIGESSLVIAIAAPHRPEAYAASRYAIERVKAILPVWKKEFTLDGEHWVEGPVAGELPPEKAEAIVRKAEEEVR